MPVVQGLGAYSIGRDVSVVIIHPLASGGRVDLSNITGFDAKPQFTQVKASRLDGNRLHADLPDGWALTFNTDRAGSGLDDLMALVEAAWRNGGTLYSASIYQNIIEPDGSNTSWHFTDCSLMFGDLGNWQADTIVKQTITGMANRRLKV